MPTTEYHSINLSQNQHAIVGANFNSRYVW